jgi:glutaconyl-CoA/methylmalonyl-CoA decarboxylase subunit gamma
MEHFRITVAGKTYDVVVEKNEGDEADIPNAAAPVPRAVAPSQPVRAAAQAPESAKVAAGAGDVTSPLAGLVQAIQADVGALVGEGDLVLTLEAMKMYTSINAPQAGTIKAMHVKVGDAVDEGQVLYTIG